MMGKETVKRVSGAALHGGRLDGGREGVSAAPHCGLCHFPPVLPPHACLCGDAFCSWRPAPEPPGRCTSGASSTCTASFWLPGARHCSRPCRQGPARRRQTQLVAAKRCHLPPAAARRASVASSTSSASNTCGTGAVPAAACLPAYFSSLLRSLMSATLKVSPPEPNKASFCTSVVSSSP